MMRRGTDPAQQLGFRDSFLTNYEILTTAIGPQMDGNACAIAEREQQRGRPCHLHLLVIARRLEFLAACEQSRVEVSRPLDGSTVQRLSNAVEFGIGRVQQNHAVLSKQSCEQPGESTAESLARAIAVTQYIRRF